MRRAAAAFLGWVRGCSHRFGVSPGLSDDQPRKAVTPVLTKPVDRKNRWQVIATAVWIALRWLALVQVLLDQLAANRVLLNQATLRLSSS
jgi:hypothetical protein